jgi:CubicO group peptidase (beta-lactamase class C family)
MWQTKIAFAVGLALLLCPPVLSAEPQSEGQEQRDWEGFIDGMVAAQQKAHHFAGAVVVVVSSGQVAFKKGYGFADFARASAGRT